MNKNFKFIVMVCFILTTLFYNAGCTYKSENKENYLMNKYPQERWLNAGATVSYNKWNKEVVIKKARFIPAWGGAILEIGTIDLSEDNYLKFKVVDLKGLYSVTVHYGGPQQYETHYVKIQEDTSMRGNQVYNVSEALRMEGLNGWRKIAIQILVVDPYNEPGKGMVRLKELSFGP